MKAGAPGKSEVRNYPSQSTDLFYISGHDSQMVAMIPNSRMVIVCLGYIPRSVTTWDKEKFLKNLLIPSIEVSGFRLIIEGNSHPSAPLRRGNSGSIVSHFICSPTLFPQHKRSDPQHCADRVSSSGWRDVFQRFLS